MLLLHDAISQKNIGSSRCSSQQELLVSSLATADALAKLLIERGLITEAEFMQKLSVERVNYQRVQRRHQRASC
jgi:hypothetical protein